MGYLVAVTRLVMTRRPPWVATTQKTVTTTVRLNPSVSARPPLKHRGDVERAGHPRATRKALTGSHYPLRIAHAP